MELNSAANSPEIHIASGTEPKRIVVAMSGGVDSSAAALLLKEQGYDVIGISMQVWDYRNHGGNAARATCCAPADFEDAREAADAYDIPFYVYDFEESFRNAVIKPFVDSYLNGLTPNPCLNCNRKVKFLELRARAKALGASVVATGHYAQIREVNGRLGLFTSTDEGKDQSYFLYALTQAELETTVFPVGHMKKPEVREYLRKKGVRTSSKPESQDICFVSSDVGSFIERQVKGQGKDSSAYHGDILSSSGEKLGQHEGIFRYTVGQRKGLRISSSDPLYVLSVDAETKKVVVGAKSELESIGFTIRGVNWISGIEPEKPIRSQVKLRYRHPGVLCELSVLEPGVVRGKFIEEWTAVSPGQAAVFYSENAEDDGAIEVFGGGIIERSN